MSLTCREEIRHVGRGCEQLSDHLDMSRWSGVLLTCPQQVVSVVIVEFRRMTRQTDKLNVEITSILLVVSSWMCNILVTSYEHVARVQGCYEETAAVEFRLK